MLSVRRAVVIECGLFRVWSFFPLTSRFFVNSQRSCASFELFWGMLGRWDRGWRVLVLQDVGTMKSLHWRCEMWVDCVERKRSAKLPWSATAPCTFAAAPSFQACLRAFHMYILYACVHICVCVYVCRHVYMYVYACVYVFVHLCVYTHVHVYVYAYLCIDCRSWYQYFSVWTVSCMRMCFRVHMYAYTYVCWYIYMCIFLQ